MRQRLDQEKPAAYDGSAKLLGEGLGGSEVRTRARGLNALGSSGDELLVVAKAVVISSSAVV